MDNFGIQNTGQPSFNPLNSELNPHCHLVVLLGAHHIIHVSRIRVNERLKEQPPYAATQGTSGYAYSAHHIFHVSRIRVNERLKEEPPYAATQGSSGYAYSAHHIFHVSRIRVNERLKEQPPYAATQGTSGYAHSADSEAEISFPFNNHQEANKIDTSLL